MNIYYQLNFYLNGEHYINHPNGQKGEVHPHSWEIIIKITPKASDIEYEFFTKMEEMTKNYLSIYEGNIINDIAPFDIINATMENMAKVFYQHIKNILDKNNYILLELSLKESPSRCVIINVTDDYEKMRDVVVDKIQEGIVNLSLFRNMKLRSQEEVAVTREAKSLDINNNLNNNKDNKIIGSLKKIKKLKFPFTGGILNFF